MLLLDSFQIDDDLISNISPDSILDDIYQINNVDLTMINNIIQEQSLSQTTVDVCTLIENPSPSLPQLPSKKKKEVNI